MNNEVQKDYDTSFYTTVNVNLRLHPRLSPKEKIVAIEIGASQMIPLDEQEPTDECLAALTGIAIEEMPTIIKTLEAEGLIITQNYEGKRYFKIKDSIRC